MSTTMKISIYEVSKELHEPVPVLKNWIESIGYKVTTHNGVEMFTPKNIRDFRFFQLIMRDREKMTLHQAKKIFWGKKEVEKYIKRFKERVNLHEVLETFSKEESEQIGNKIINRLLLDVENQILEKWEI